MQNFLVYEIKNTLCGCTICIQNWMPHLVYLTWYVLSQQTLVVHINQVLFARHRAAEYTKEDIVFTFRELTFSLGKQRNKN